MRDVLRESRSNVVHSIYRKETQDLKRGVHEETRGREAA